MPPLMFGPCIVLLLAAMFQNVAGQLAIHDADYRSIRAAADAREPLRLMAFLGKNAAKDAWALEALGSVQSDTALVSIFTALSAPASKVRTAAAFAAGQTLRDSKRTGWYEPLLVKRMLQEKDESVRAAIMDALGRCAGMQALDAVAAIQVNSVVSMKAQALSIGRFAVRGVRSAKATIVAAGIAQRLLKEGFASDAASAAYALMRIGDSAFLAEADGAFLAAATASDPAVRAYTAAALGARKTGRAFSEVIRLSTDPNPWVGINAIRATAKFRFLDSESVRVLHSMLHAALRSGEYHRVKTVLQTIPLIGSIDDSCARLIERQYRYSPVMDLRVEAIRSLAAVYPVRARGIVEDMLRDTVLPAGAYEAIGILARKEQKTDEFFTRTLSVNLTGREAATCNAAIEAYGICWRIAREKEHVMAFDSSDMLFLNALLHAMDEHARPAKQNPAGVQAIVEIFQDSLFRSPSTVSSLKDALKNFSSRDNVETVIALIDGLGKTGNPDAAGPVLQRVSDENRAVRNAAVRALAAMHVTTPPAEERSPDSRELDWNVLTEFQSNPVVDVSTTHGMVRIELFVDEAPYTVAAFIGLVRSGFYDGLPFHRVVPNFVVQGGDPRGDGTGGPPFTLRSEFSPRSFIRGMVGIASAGKDTEGSQFFIMHSDHPHLDGRYTLFGTVIDGMEVVDAIQIGDRIETIVVHASDDFHRRN